MNKEIRTSGILKIRVPLLAVVTVSLPFFAFLTCIYLSVVNNFSLATATHCGVPNYLPSISSAIGEFVPQRYIWRFAIAVHSAPRFMMVGLYSSFMKSVLPPHPVYEKLRKVNAILNLVENCALLGLSFVSSRENYDLHKVFFITFMLCSELYMILTYLLMKDNTQFLAKPLERLAFRKKKQLMSFNIFCFFFALYFFYRHNAYCETGMYTFFAFFEYMVVLSNMGFHMTAYYDFYDHELVIGERTSSLSSPS
ncbi:UNVERIFIED_CONTAM: hypothetical protein RMT77_003957 [Armadillidium vulgare]